MSQLSSANAVIDGRDEDPLFGRFVMEFHEPTAKFGQVSHDILLIRPKRDLANINEFRDPDDGPDSLGGLPEVRAIIESVFPGTKWDSEVWGHIEAGSVTAQVSLQNTEAYATVRLFSHLGSGDLEPFDRAIATLFERYGWQAFSFSDGDRLRPNGHSWRMPSP